MDSPVSHLFLAYVALFLSLDCSNFTVFAVSVQHLKKINPVPRHIHCLVAFKTGADIGKDIH